MNSENVLQAQRRLRGNLLDDRCTLPWRPAREFAAQLLLYVDDPAQCWRVGAEWLREILDADRVDGGFAEPGQVSYAPQAESLRPGRVIPSVVGASMDARDPGMACVWAAEDVVVFEDIANDTRFGAQLQAQLATIGTRTKLAIALRDGSRPMGLICADWIELRQTWESEAYANLSLLTRLVLGPVLMAAQSLVADSDNAVSAPMQSTGKPGSSRSLTELTPAELRVARMAAKGMSYKEIARELNRSFSTIDHQLRSVRDKLGVNSTARLVRILSDHFQGS